VEEAGMLTGDGAPVARLASAAIAVVIILAVTVVAVVVLG
jgi:hypothetical protein